MNLNKLFESLDEKVFTTELKEALEAQFNEAVDMKSAVLAESSIEEKIEELNEKSEKHIDFLNTKADEYVELQKQEIVEAVDKYLEHVVDEFVSEAKDSLAESIKSEKSDMILEAFDSMLVATGVEVATIVEAKDNSEADAKLTESEDKYNSLVDENIELKEQNEKLLKMGIVSEMKEGLSLVESQKFEKLADIVEFVNDETFVNKLETIKESVKGTAEVIKERLDEADDKDDAPIYAHLI